MGQSDRLYRLKSQLDAGRCVAPKALQAEFGVSPATVKRDIAYLRDRLNSPVVFNRELGGYRLERSAQLPGAQYELPGLWFTADEIHALLTMQHLLAHLDAGGLLKYHIAPLAERLGKMLGSSPQPSAEIVRRVRVQTVGARHVHLPHFQAVGTALLQRKRLQIAYHARSRDETTDREVSPQRLIHYRDNWYLDAWCHLRRGLRSFAVDAMRSAQVLDHKAIDVSEYKLDAALGGGYGIFAGRKVKWATLRFTPERARWVGAEGWHPKQVGRFEADGSYVLRVPYADPRELVMDILRHVPEVAVVGPAGLRNEIAERLRVGLSGLTR